MDLQKESPSEARDVRILARRRSRDGHGLSVKGGGSTQYDILFISPNSSQNFVGKIKWCMVCLSYWCTCL